MVRNECHNNGSKMNGGLVLGPSLLVHLNEQRIDTARTLLGDCSCSAIIAWAEDQQ
jgi:hypothetical protein